MAGPAPARGRAAGTWRRLLGLSAAVSLAQTVASIPRPDVVQVDELWLTIALSPWAGVAAFVWGALWGSFANVVIHRLPKGESVVRPRSRCPRCKQTIAGFDNIPVLSYLVLRGRCRRCREPVPLRYLLVELLGGMLSFALWMALVHVPLVEGGAIAVGRWLATFVFAMALVVVIFIDIDDWTIPDVVVLPMAGIGIALAAIDPEIVGISPAAAAAAAAGGWAAFAGIRLLYLRLRGIEVLGRGDAKLLAMVGAFTGPAGVAWCVGAGAVQGLLVAVPMLLAGRNVATVELRDAHGDDPLLAEDPDRPIMGRYVPFGPFLGLAALEYAILGPQINELLSTLLGF